MDRSCAWRLAAPLGLVLASLISTGAAHAYPAELVGDDRSYREWGVTCYDTPEQTICNSNDVTVVPTTAFEDFEFGDAQHPSTLNPQAVLGTLSTSEMSATGVGYVREVGAADGYELSESIFEVLFRVHFETTPWHLFGSLANETGEVGIRISSQTGVLFEQVQTAWGSSSFDRGLYLATGDYTLRAWAVGDLAEYGDSEFDLVMRQEVPEPSAALLLFATLALLCLRPRVGSGC